MVYAMIVRSKVRNTFEQINSGNYAAMVDGLAPEFEYVFRGEHALGGRRVTKEAMNRWWERTLSVLPGATFDVQEVLVNGGRGTHASRFALLSADRSLTASGMRTRSSSS
jgi:ketosteroid isomerase-like protein